MKSGPPTITQLNSATSERQQQQTSSKQRTSNSRTTTSDSANNTSNKNRSNNKKRRKRYARKLPLPPSEKAVLLNRRKRHRAYESMRTQSLERTNEPPSVWSFDSLFPSPVLDEKSVREDLFGSKEREGKMRRRQVEMEKTREQKRIELERQEREYLLDVGSDGGAVQGNKTDAKIPVAMMTAKAKDEDIKLTRQTIMEHNSSDGADDADGAKYLTSTPQQQQEELPPPPVDKALSRMVQDRIYGLTRSPAGSIQYTTSLLDSSKAVQFREGVRLGRALSINIDRLCYFAKRDLRQNKLEEAQGYYSEAMGLDPSDGRPYLGLSRIAQRRGDLEGARALLREGIRSSSGGHVVVKGPSKVNVVEGKEKKKNRKERRKEYMKNKSNVDFEEEEGSTIGTIPDLGPNPFLLQALGTLEQKLGNISAAEELYLRAIRSRPSHAAAWVSLAQLRTRELRQGAGSGRACYRSAERELQAIGAKPNSYVYTAWASMEYKKGSREGDDSDKSIKKARELYRKALEVDPRCSAAYLQLGVMENECGNYDDARDCFETVLEFDQRNSRVLQAYAIMESRRLPREDVDSRKVLDLFERALKVNPRDAGVYQAYALYVVEWGDVESARDLLRKGTEVNKRHAPAWQAWGVLETRYSTAQLARDVFQQGIWSCAQPGGGQSGGRRCARLWQAWGVLESREGDHAAARRCFSRALDADKRNVAAITAWAGMEAELGNFADARSIFERSLKLFRSPSVDKTAIWRAYEVMEERAGNTTEAQMVFGRSMRESMAASSAVEEDITTSGGVTVNDTGTSATRSRPKSAKMSNSEVEVSRWDTGSNELDAEVWINNGSIEGKVPPSMMKKLKNRR